MKTVQQILNAKGRPVLSTRRTATVYEALSVMALYEVGALVVLEEGDLIGMFSERDYARKVILHGKSSKEIPVADIMTTRVLCVRRDTTIEGCMALMTDKRIRHLPVVEFVPPSRFDEYAAAAREMGFVHVASGPKVRSSYHADDFQKPEGS